MISTLTYNENQKELQSIVTAIKDLIAYVSEEEWRMMTASLPEEILKYLDEVSIMDFLVYDVRNRESIENLRRLKSVYKDTSLCLIADTTMSPMEYMKPDILASSLLLRPFSSDKAKEVFSEFFQSALKVRGNEDQRKHFFVVESREGTIQVPYDQIMFFEARNKKIYVCTNKEEFGFYTTIEQLEEELPEGFVRCHRGFIVNTDKIRKVQLSQNIIYLTDGFDVPLSRSYKAVVKDLVK